jgi:uncharacterized protein YceK
MRSWSLLLFPILFLLSGCSSVSTRVDYHVSKTEGVQPICTTWNSTSGAALADVFETQILIKTPAHYRSNFFGPLLIPFIPVYLGKKSINPGIEIQILPKDGKTLLLPLNDIELLFDGKKVIFNSASYRVKGQANSEITYGSLDQEKLNSSVEVKQPYAIVLENSKVQSPPTKIELHFVIYSGSEKQKKVLYFNKESDVEYNPFFIPGQEMHAKCKTKFSRSSNGWDLF